MIVVEHERAGRLSFITNEQPDFVTLIEREKLIWGSG